MDRREFLRLMAAAGALSTMGPGCLQPANEIADGGADSGGDGGGGGGDAGPPPDPHLDYVLRTVDTPLTPYLVIPRLNPYDPTDPEWNSWAGEAWAEYSHPPGGFWFYVPEVGQSVDVVLPVINLGNMTTRHLVLELYEGPPSRVPPLSECELRDRKGPLVLHPGRITGFAMRFTRQRQEGSSIAICYDPFFDPIHAIEDVGLASNDRKNLGKSAGIQAPIYPTHMGG
jgi:hypothetical protein